MKDLLFILSSERKMVRNYALMAVGIGCLTLVGVQQLVRIIGTSEINGQQKITASSAPASVKNYTVMRSVLDDQMTTGSISSMNQIRLDPCKQ